LWVLSFVYAGHFFGNLPVVRHNFTLLIFGIIAVSFAAAMVIGMVKARRSASKATSEGA
jgi:membrane-associated protein